MCSTELLSWAARYNTWLLIKLTPKGVVFLVFFIELLCSQGGLMKRISKGWRRGSSSQGTASTVTSSGADSRGSARSGGMASIAFTGSSGGRSRHHNLLMETNMAFENGSDGGRTKRSHGAGFFAFSQVGWGGCMGSVMLFLL